jgi:hypothetical protein
MLSFHDHSGFETAFRTPMKASDDEYDWLWLLLMYQDHQLSIDPSVLETMCDEQALTGSPIMRSFQRMEPIRQLTISSKQKECFLLTRILLILYYWQSICSVHDSRSF